MHRADRDQSPIAAARTSDPRLIARLCIFNGCMAVAFPLIVRINYSMRWQFSLTLLFALALAGCTTPHKATRDQTQAKAPSSHEEETSTEASDRRTEAHARYANG